MKSKLIITSLLAAALISPIKASAQCSIQESRLQQISEREILAIIDGYCTREDGESGYYTEISSGVFGEVMAVYGHRNIDQRGQGFQSRYGFNIVFRDSAETYRAGVWIADSDGVVHSAEMSIANAFYATTTTTTVPQTTTTTSQPVVQPAPVAYSEPVAEIVQVPVATTTTTIASPVESIGADVVVQIIKQITKKKAVQKCSSRLKSCKSRVVGVARTTGQR
jgi:hypothetical protein